MSRIKYISVIEIEGKGRIIRPGKADRSGAQVVIPTPENDRDDWERREWERIEVFDLPESMPKSEFVDWWNDHKDDDPQPSPIPEAIAALDENPHEAEGGAE